LYWSQTGTGGVTFGSRTCALSQTTASHVSSSGIQVYTGSSGYPIASCSIVLTGGSPGSVSVQATYTGDPSNAGSSGQAKITVNRAVPKLSLSCASLTVHSGNTDSCTATISNGYLPLGTLTWTEVSGSGSVNLVPSSCQLPSLSCTVTVSATSPGSAVLRVDYPGDVNNQGISGTIQLTLN
jgi:hypothetical protein